MCGVTVAVCVMVALCVCDGGTFCVVVALCVIRWHGVWHSGTVCGTVCVIWWHCVCTVCDTVAL